MRRNLTVARHAATLLLVPLFFAAGCQKQTNSSQPVQEKMAGGRHHGLRAACADDIQKYCVNADRKRRCLRENMDKLSDSCKAAVGPRGSRKARDNGGDDD